MKDPKLNDLDLKNENQTEEVGEINLNTTPTPKSEVTEYCFLELPSGQKISLGSSIFNAIVLAKVACEILGIPTSETKKTSNYVG